MRRILLALLVLAVVGGGSWFAYQATAEEKTPPPPSYEVYAVTRGDISATVSATGSIEPAASVNLNFRSAGRVVAVLVEAGDRVEQGQVLARLEAEDLELAREQAVIGLRLAQARFDQAMRPAEASDLAAAAAAMESAAAGLAAAQTSYQDLLRGPTAAQRRSAEATQERARVVLEAAQQAYNQVAHLPNAGMLPQAVQLQQATIDYEVARANVENTLAPATAGQKAAALAQIAQAESALAQAQANLERLSRGISAEDREVLEAQVAQAEISVRQADLALKNAILAAPIAGVVGAVNLRANEFATGGLPAIILTDDTKYHIDLNVDEIDIGQLAVGQEAAIAVDALSGVVLTGVVSNIAPIAATGLGGAASIVTYQVTVDVDAIDVPLRPGLTATVSITTAEARDVIVLANRVMRLDRQTGQTYVEKIVNGVPQRVDLQVGLRNEQFSQILSGLQEGDQLAVRRTDTGDILRQQFFGG